MEGFTLFDNSSVSRVVDKITITKNYLINFPSAFYKINNLAGKKTVLLFYNSNTNEIAIMFKDEYDERGFKISAPNNGKNGGYITAKNFFAMNNLLDKIKTGRYSYRRIQKAEGSCNEDMYVLQLESNKNAR